MHGNLSPAARARAAAGPFASDSSPRSPVSGAAPDTAPDPFAVPDPFAGAAPPSPPAHNVQDLHLADSAATLMRATGSDDARVQDWLVNDLSFALNMPPLPGSEVRKNRVCAAVSALCDIGPRDTMEGMLAAQMVAVHSAALGCLRRAAVPAGADRARDADLHHAARLLNVFQRQMRVRDDRRNPVLAHSLTGASAPGAPGGASPARVAPVPDRDAEPAAEAAPDAAAERRTDTGGPG